jgi:hypothetical protein
MIAASGDWGSVSSTATPAMALKPETIAMTEAMNWTASR